MRLRQYSSVRLYRLLSNPAPCTIHSSNYRIHAIRMYYFCYICDRWHLKWNFWARGKSSKLKDTLIRDFFFNIQDGIQKIIVQIVFWHFYCLKVLTSEEHKAAIHVLEKSVDDVDGQTDENEDEDESQNPKVYFKGYTWWWYTAFHSKSTHILSDIRSIKTKRNNFIGLIFNNKKTLSLMIIYELHLVR